MSVIINDFEIIPETSEEDVTVEEVPMSESEKVPIRPLDVVAIVDRDRRRKRRLRAH